MSANDTHQKRTGQCQLDSASTPFSLEPSLFPLVKLHLCTRILNGGTPKSNSEYWNGEVPFVTPPDLRDLKGGIVSTVERTLTAAGVESGSNTISKGVIISGRAPVGYVGIVDSPAAFNQGCKGLESEHEHRFLSYAMVASSGNLNALANGTTFLELSTTSLENYRIPLPPLETQQRIADYLDVETAQIDTTVSTLDELIEEMKSRRVQLIQESISSPDSHVGSCEFAEINPSSHEGMSEFPQVPLGLVAHAYQPETLSMEALNQSGDFPVFGANGMIGRHDNFNHEQPQVVIACRGTCGAVNRTLPNSWINGNAMVINPNAEKLRKDFLFYVLEVADYSLVITGSAQPQITRESLYRLRIPLPPLENQQRIADFLDIETVKIDKIISTATELRSELLARRSAIITEVVTGQRQV